LIFLLVQLIDIYIVVVLAAVILSWVRLSPGNPVQQLVDTLTEPVLSTARRIIPPIGGLDVSPILVLIALNVLRSILVQSAAR
jgi:YggT family protein